MRRNGEQMRRVSNNKKAKPLLDTTPAVLPFPTGREPSPEPARREVGAQLELDLRMPAAPVLPMPWADKRMITKAVLKLSKSTKAEAAAWWRVELSFLRRSLAARGVSPDRIEKEAARFEAVIKAALLRARFEGPGFLDGVA
jgi:Family of unknown function (DUF6074)